MDGRGRRTVEHTIDGSRARAIASLERAEETLLDVIDTNRRMAERREHRPEALQRVHDGEEELAELRAMLRRLREVTRRPT